MTAPTPPEIVEARVVEEVARAMAEVQGVGRTATPLTRRLAAVAVATYRAAQDGGAEEAVRRHPCYCLPGAARCDDPYTWCDRVDQLEGMRDHGAEDAVSELPTPQDEATGRRFARMRTQYRASAIAALIAETRAEARRAALATQAGDSAR